MTSTLVNFMIGIRLFEHEVPSPFSLTPQWRGRIIGALRIDDVESEEHTHWYARGCSVAQAKERWRKRDM